jgi:orotidine 5'-phosphate decarboxylase subfamily 2
VRSSGCAVHPRDVSRRDLILDAKRGDIGSTAEHYAEEAFGRYGAHAVTVNPYLGTDSVAPYFEYGGGVIALCRTSNPGGDDIQSLVADGRPIYAHVARLVADDWSKRGDCGLVVGATYPSELADVRSDRARSPDPRARRRRPGRRRPIRRGARGATPMAAA